MAPKEGMGLRVNGRCALANCFMGLIWASGALNSLVLHRREWSVRAVAGAACLCVQLEQYGSGFFNPLLFEVCKAAVAVWDYDPDNASHLAKQNISVQLARPGYHPLMELPTSIPSKVVPLLCIEPWVVGGRGMGFHGSSHGQRQKTNRYRHRDVCE